VFGQPKLGRIGQEKNYEMIKKNLERSGTLLCMYDIGDQAESQENKYSIEEVLAQVVGPFLEDRGGLIGLVAG
jgi:hypothetical protein